MILKKDATSIIIEWISKDCLWWKELGKHQILCSAPGGKKKEKERIYIREGKRE